MSLDRETFKYIEKNIFDLPEMLQEIQFRREELLYPFDEEPDHNDIKGRSSVMTITDTTARRASALVEDRRIRKMEEKTDAILRVYDKLIAEKKEVIKLYYWQKPRLLTWDGVAKETNTSRSTCLRWRKKFIQDIADELGET